jgi:hypothetical protein
MSDQTSDHQPAPPADSVLLTTAVMVTVGFIGLGLWRDIGTDAISTGTFVILTGAILFDSRLTRKKAVEAVEATLQDSELTRRQDRDNLERTLRAEKLAREAADRPLVLAYLIRNKLTLELVIRNVGNAPAAHVKFSFNRPISSALLPEFAETAMLKHGMHTLPPGVEITTPFDSARDHFSETHRAQYLERHGFETPLVYPGTVQYQHALAPHRTFSEPFVLDVASFEGQMWRSEKGVKHIAEEMQKIRATLQAIERDGRTLGELADRWLTLSNDTDDGPDGDDLSDVEIQQILDDMTWGTQSVDTPG